LLKSSTASVVALLLAGGVAFQDIFAASAATVAAIAIASPSQGAEVGLQETVVASVRDTDLRVAVLVRASNKDWWVQNDSARPERQEFVVVAQFGERGIGWGEIYEIVAVADRERRFGRGERFGSVPGTLYASRIVRVKKTRD